MYAINTENGEEMFSIPVVARRLDAVEVAQSWKKSSRNHLLNFSFLFTSSQHITYFRIANHLRMRDTITEAEIVTTINNQASRILAPGPTMQERLDYMREHYLVLDVSRDNVLEDTFDQLWHRRLSELLRPLRVRLGEEDGFEIGHDLGGVQIEFFNLVCKESFKESNRMSPA